ncbi:MAG: M20 family metallopeptidase [Actinobacteria bacterium]|nr:M20 family metallopeptidase [Actinomycetota bacterium]
MAVPSRRPNRPEVIDHLSVTREFAEARATILTEVSHSIWDHPELCFEERHAHGVLVEQFERAGVDVTGSAHGLDTAFVAEAGTEGPTVAVICEYDALPGIGHACGHNVIAAAGLGAGLALAAFAEEHGGRVRIIGTPAEEGGGGKELLIRAGAFDGVDAAVMVHPADRDLPTMEAIAVHQVHACYSGRSAHAAAAPERGRNALDAAVLGYVNVAALRQHTAVHERIHGVFTDGGAKPNIVPESAATHWYVRSATSASLRELEPRVEACLHAGAVAAGCEVELRWVDPAYDEMIHDPWLLERFGEHAAVLGRTLEDPEIDGPVVGSTDMGNVSQRVPSIHPMIAVAPRGVPIHTPEFATHARSAAGDRAAVDGAALLAATVLDYWHRDR